MSYTEVISVVFFVIKETAHFQHRLDDDWTNASANWHIHRKKCVVEAHKFTQNKYSNIMKMGETGLYGLNKINKSAKL